MKSTVIVSREIPLNNLIILYDAEFSDNYREVIIIPSRKCRWFKKRSHNINDGIIISNDDTDSIKKLEELVDFLKK